MKILVCGCGKIGEALISALAAEGHDVTAIDNDPAALRAITNVQDVIGVCGNGADCDTLEEAGVTQTELFLAVTGSDELNMLACFLAKRMGAGHTIARIRNPEYNDASLDFMKRELGLSLAINPDMLAARKLYDILKMPTAAKIETFGGRSFEILELKLKDDSPLDGLSLRELRQRIRSRVLICMVQRDDDVTIPDGDFILKGGDRIGITAPPAEVAKFLRQTDMLRKQGRSTMILGGSKTAFYLAKMLCEDGGAVKIIEQNPLTAAELADALPDASVIRGDGAQQELLLEEGIRTTDAFVALTGMDEENILISIYASSQAVSKVIAKVNRNELLSMAEKLGLDTLLSPKAIVVDVAVRYARALENSRGSKVETLYKLMDGRVEAAEFTVKETPRLTGIPLKLLPRRPNTLLAGIKRGRRTIVPDGDDMLLPDDRVIVLAAGVRLSDLSDILV